ncbi:hypothetical protein D3C83_268600 [compost metagenome]
MSTRIFRRSAASGVQALKRSSRCPVSGMFFSSRGCGQSLPHNNWSGLAFSSASCNGFASG